MQPLIASREVPRPRTLVWFRGKDLRISDHAPLRAALDGPFAAVFVVDPFFFAPERARELPHRIQFLLDALDSLSKNFIELGGELVLLGGRSVDVIPAAARSLGVDRVLAHRWTEPFGRHRDRLVKSRLSVPFELYEGETLLPPESVRTGEGRPYSVFTPFSKAVRQRLAVAKPLGKPPSLASTMDLRPLAPFRVSRPSLEDLGLARNPHLQAAGERVARERLRTFLRTRLGDYASSRDRLDQDGTSRLSADLKFGTLSVRTAWDAVSRLPPGTGRERFEAELLWREFALATLWDRPELLKIPFRAAFRHFPYVRDDAHFLAWSEGRTGYPLVDAAQRQLLREGFVHNRARMISASFLTKNLLVDPRKGEAFYLKYLTDGDYAANNMGWQWCAGSGVDAAPYFRVFNPVSQSEKFDPEGHYLRRYLPELARLPTRHLHAPWRAPEKELARAGIELGRTYPRPVVPDGAARAQFLALAERTLRASDAGRQPPE